MATYVTIPAYVQAWQYLGTSTLVIENYTLGEVYAHPGDWIIGSQIGCVYPMPDTQFLETYQYYSG